MSHDFFNDLLPIIGWRIYYGDGSVFTSADGSWDDAPSEDVQILEYVHAEPYHTLCLGEDEYFLTPDSSVKYGKWADTAWFESLRESVVNAGWQSLIT